VGVADHPQYRRIMTSQAGDRATNCTQNYSCSATAANQGPAQADSRRARRRPVPMHRHASKTNTRGDGTPYVLTARHCQTGKAGWRRPQCSRVRSSFIGDAVSACGADPAIDLLWANDTSAARVTVVEQQDAWLIKLDTPPGPPTMPSTRDGMRAANQFTGGYSIHHALGNDKQYVSWYGRALLQTLFGRVQSRSVYNSTFWGVVNELGRSRCRLLGRRPFRPRTTMSSAAAASRTW